MGFDFINLTWDFSGDNELKQASTSARHAATIAVKNREVLIDMQKRFNRLALACEVMWELLQEKTDITEQDLLTRMSELDKRVVHPTRCLQCNKTLSNTSFQHGKCLFCGTLIKRTDTGPF